MEETTQRAVISKEKAGVVAHEPDEFSDLDWEEIDWPAIEREVSRLQARIVKAEQREAAASLAKRR